MMKINKKMSSIEDLSLSNCYNVLEGKGLPDMMKQGQINFLLNVTEEEAREFCDLFENKFNKKLDYQHKRGFYEFRYAQ